MKILPAIIDSAAAWYGCFMLAAVVLVLFGLDVLMLILDPLFRLMGGPGLGQ